MRSLIEFELAIIAVLFDVMEKYLHLALTLESSLQWVPQSFVDNASPGSSSTSITLLPGLDIERPNSRESC